MTDLTTLRNQLGTARSAVDDRRAQLAALDAELDEARRSGDAAAVTQVLARRAGANQELTTARNGFSAASDRFASGIRDAGIFVDVGVVPPAEAPLDGVDEAVPIALLPVRLETRIRDGHLLIRIFPDDVHVDDHEPLLDDRELAAGEAYWSAVAAGGDDALDGAWNLLAASVGTYRASWVREQTQPGPAGTTPDLTLRPAGTARAAVARALPDLFVARVRTATGSPIVVQGSPVLDEVQVGMEWGGNPTDLLDEEGTLQRGMAWMSDFATAVDAGLALDVDLDGATSILDVTVVGVTVSLDAEASATLLGELIADHRVSHGAGIVAPGTPTNNLSDSPAGVDFRPPPATLDPAAAPAPDPRSDAAALAGALGLPIEALSALPGAASAAVAGQAAMQRALFEATWGPYLRQFGVPAVKPAQLAAVYRHVTGYLRPGGPLPVLRLGKQPYGILPVQPAGAAATEDEPFLRWLTGFLPGVRDLWLSGRDEAPHGLDILGFEPASSRIRIRTAIAQYSYRALVDTGIVEPGGVAGVSDALLIAELGLGGTAIPMAARNYFAEATAPLRLPMAVDGDTDFDVRDPKPKDATSILGLLLRNAAVQVVDTAVNEQLAGSRVVDEVALARPLTASFTTLSSAAISPNTEISVSVPMTAVQKLAHTVTLDDGTTGSVADWVGQLVGDVDLIRRPIDLGAYRARDAVRAFSASLGDIAALPVEQRALTAGQVIDSASHRYDAWVTSLATRRLGALRATTPNGIQLGAWGYVSGFTAEELQEVPGRPGVVTDPRNRGWVLAPSIRHAATAGVLRAAWAEHGAGAGSDAFAVDLHSDRVRLALGLAQGMRQGQQLGALLGYRIERSLHEAFATRNVEADWLIFELRRQFPLRIRTLENASENLADERLVVNGWTLADEELASAGAVTAKLAPAIADAYAAASAAARPGLVAAATAALGDAVGEAIGALDAFADVNLAEALYQLDGSNFERAAAATDAIGRAGPPPDTYDVVATPRPGTGIEQRLLLLPGTEARPPGYADSTPRSLLAPRTDAFLAARLGPLDDLGVRVTDWNGFTLATVPLDSLGLSALDLAADAAHTGGPGLFPLLTAAAIAASGLPTSGPGAGVATSVGVDDLRDPALLTLLRRAAAWHRALAGKRPLSPTSFSLQGASSTPAAAAQLTAAVAAARTLLTPANARLFGVLAPDGTQVEQDVERRAAAADAAADPVEAARALFGDAPVLEATVTAPESIRRSAADQAGLGVSAASLAGWLQDSARVRDAARDLDEAVLLDELTGGPVLPLTAAQEPVFPYREATPATRAWVGDVHPLPLGEASVTSIVAVGSGNLDGDVTGIELDAWSELVPDRIAPGAVTANLAAPNSRAPNTILLGVPGDGQWTRSALFSLVDEALELADCRQVDLDAAKRIPRLLPAIFLSDYDEDDARPWRDILTSVTVDPARWRWMGSPS
jgi:hypothetical protein